MLKIKTQTRIISDQSPVYIIAEIGSNFDGSLKKAFKMIDLAAKVGADCAKFQSFLPDKIISKSGFGKTRNSFQAKWTKPVYQVYKEASLPREWHVQLKRYCDKRSIDFASAPYDTAAVDLLVDIGVPFLKIGSGEVSNLEFIRYVARTKKPLLISVGSVTLAEIDEMMQVIRKTGNERVLLLQCVTNYPSPFEDANIRFIETLRSAFGVMVGYSDHTPGHTVPLGAVTLGAKVIEKHFTDNKQGHGPDHPFALDPNEFATMVKEIRNLEMALGSGVKTVYASEAETQVLQRRSLYSAVDIKSGQMITRDMLTILRPAKGVQPKLIDVFVGKLAQRDLAADSPVNWDLITQN